MVILLVILMVILMVNLILMVIMVILARCIIEPIAIYLTAELLGLIELIHAMRIVHADIKPDNFLLCHTPSSSRFVENIGHAGFG